MKLPILAAAVSVLLSASATARDFVRHPDGIPQDSAVRNQVQVLNFWAAWCTPCRKEMPAISTWYRSKAQKQNIQLVGIALDHADNISTFLKTTPVSYPIWRYTGHNSRAMMRDFGNRVGGLPYTVVRMPQCSANQAVLGEVDGTKLDRAIAALQTACRTGKQAKPH